MARPIPLPPELSPLQADDPAAIGPFRPVGRLGAGGMGAVYGALDQADRCVAVKVVHPRLASRPQYRAAFAREADLLRSLDAECAPAFLGADPAAEPPWMAIEFVPGRTLRARVRESGPLEPPALAAFAAGTAEALQALHGLGIVHCDIKPGNVVLAPSGPRVLDFGIARAADRPGPDRIEGTPGYLAPERLEGAPPSPAVDVFAWGAMVAYAATGRPPFGSGDTEAVLARTRAGEYDLDGLPEGVRGIVEGALVSDPARRPTADACCEAALAVAAPGEPAVPDESSVPDHRAAPQAEDRDALRARLRAALASAWHGFDAAGHRPEAWAAAGAVAAGGAAVIGAAAGGTATGGATTGTATTGGAASGTAGGGASVGSLGGAAGTAGGATGGTAGGAVGASAGGGLGGSAAAGGGSALLGAKGAAIASAAVLAAGAAGIGGYLGYESYAASQREELAASAASLLEEGAGFTASLVREPADGAGVDDLFQAELLYTTDPQDVLVYRLPQGRGGETVANVGGRVLAYAPDERVAGDPAGWYAEADRFTSDAYSRDAVLGAASKLAGAEDLEDDETEVGGIQATLLSGSFTVDGPDGEPVGVRGELALDAEGVPLRLSYASADWTTTVDFTSVDDAPPVKEPEDPLFMPQADLYEHPFDQLLYTPSCGRVSADGDDWEVHAVAWEMGCKEAMDLSRRFADDEGEFMRGWAGTGMQRVYLGGYSCQQVTPHLPEGGPSNERLLSSCSVTEHDPDAADPLDQYEVGRTVVRFTEPGN